MACTSRHDLYDRRHPWVGDMKGVVMDWHGVGRKVVDVLSWGITAFTAGLVFVYILLAWG